MKKIIGLVAVLSVAVGLAYAGEYYLDFLRADTIHVYRSFVAGDAGSPAAIVKYGSEVQAPNTATYSAVSTATTISPIGVSFIVINGTGTLSVQTTPSISTHSATAGQMITIMGGANVVTFSDDGTLAKSALQLGSTTRALGTGDILNLRYYNGYWYEEGFFNN